ncbi:unnamed protein product [Phaeothamnion confervicola]
MSAFRQRVVLPLLAIAVSCIAGILLVEIALRLVDYSRPPFYRYDSETGTSHRPNVEGWYEREDLIKIRINSHGLRGPEVPIAKPPGVFRIAVLGDSFAEGFQVTFDSRFSKVMEDAFGAGRCGGDKRVEVLNFGVSGYGQAREILMFRHRVVAYQPDLVLLQFHGGNDFRNNTKEMERNPFNPYFVFEGDKLVLDRGALDSVAFVRKVRWSNLRNDIVNRVRVLQVLQDYYERTIIQAETAAAEAAGVDPGVTNVRTLSVAPPQDDMDRKAWRLTEAHLRLLAQEVRAATGRPLWVMNVPPALALMPNPRARKAQLDALGLADADYVENRLADFFRADGIEFVPLTARLRSYAERNGIDLHHFEYRGGLGGHWNARAHGEAGRAIAAAMCSAIASR